MNAEAIGQFAHSHSDPACAKVVAGANQRGDISAAEEPLKLAFVDGVSLLYF